MLPQSGLRFKKEEAPGFWDPALPVGMPWGTAPARRGADSLWKERKGRVSDLEVLVRAADLAVRITARSV